MEAEKHTTMVADGCRYWMKQKGSQNKRKKATDTNIMDIFFGMTITISMESKIRSFWESLFWKIC